MKMILNNKSRLLSVLALLSSLLPFKPAIAQETAAATLPKAVSSQLPAGHLVLNQTAGDLNGDSYKDLIVVLKSPKEDKEYDMDQPVRRPLLIFLGKKGGAYTLAFRNDKVIMCSICGGMMGDPFTGVTIKNGYFTAEHYGGSGDRWTDYYTFRYSATDGKFYLSRIDTSSFSTSAPDKVKKTVRTTKNFGKVAFTQFDQDKDY